MDNFFRAELFGKDRMSIEFNQLEKNYIIK